MIKKIFICLLCFIVLFTITGCGKKSDIDNKDIIKGTNNSLVLYFSATGNTKEIAERIADISNSNLIEIVPKDKYSSSDLDYNSDCRANREQNDSSARPEIENEIDISKYDTVFLGYPIWWGTNPKIILTLLDTYDFTGKTIIPFCTSGSSNITDSVNDLRKYNSNLNIKDGKRFSISDSDDVIKEFINNNIEVKSVMKVIIDGNEYLVNLENNDTVNSLLKLLPLEVTMTDLNNNEKYVNLDKSLPTDSYYPKTINKGDVMLYGDDCLVIFYESFDTTFSYTKIGHIDNIPDLGSGSITVRFE